MGILERIAEIESEMARTQKNKATMGHLGLLKARLAKLRRELIEPKGGGGGTGEGFDVAKTGDARIGFVGFPSVGKSTLLSNLAGVYSEVAAYEFTTLTTVPGVIRYKGAKIQLLDLPGIIEGAKDGKGRGKQVIAVARTCGLIFIVLDVLKPLQHKKLIEKELEGFGIRLNKNPPNIGFRKKEKGGINLQTLVTQSELDIDIVKSILGEYKINNADVVLRDDVTADDLVDVVEGNRVYIPCIYLLNKIDQISIEMQAPGEARKDQSAKGRNFLKALKDKQVVFWLHFMLDVIKALSSLSRSIQTKNSTVGDVYNELEACKAIMTNYMKSDGPNVRKFLNAYNEMEKLLESSRKAFLSKLVQSITTRFEGDMHLFKGSTVLSFHKWPGSLEDEPEFGNSHISELVEVCRPNLGDEIVDCIEAEWTRFKQELYSSKQPLQSYTWDVAADRYMSSYPNLFMLVDYLLTLPSCSVDAERGFSSMKMIKNDWRSRLGSQNLSDLILVSLETASVEVYDPTKAINMWNTGGIRSKRPFYKDELKKELDVIYKVPHCVPISAHHKWNFDDLLEKMWDYLQLVRIYTKPKGQLPDYTAPVVLKGGKNSIEDFCNKLHRTIIKEFKCALVWGTSVKHQPQKVGKDHVLMDEDVVQIIKRH